MLTVVDAGPLDEQVAILRHERDAVPADDRRAADVEFFPAPLPEIMISGSLIASKAFTAPGGVTMSAQAAASASWSGKLIGGTPAGLSEHGKSGALDMPLLLPLPVRLVVRSS